MRPTTYHKVVLQVEILMRDSPEENNPVASEQVEGIVKSIHDLVNYDCFDGQTNIANVSKVLDIQLSKQEIIPEINKLNEKNGSPFENIEEYFFQGH